MALINNKKEFLGGIGLLVTTNMAAINDIMPDMQLHTKEEIVYDAVTVEGVAPEYTSFSQTAKVVKKDGKDRVTLKPVNFNNAISKETIDADAEQFGQNEYGDGTVDATIQSALTGVGKLKLNAEVGKKKLFYEALTTHKITGGYIGENGKEDIVFNVPAANKEIFDGTTKKYWSNSAATSVSDINRAYMAMKIKPSRVIMNPNTYANFLASTEITTADNTSTGVKKNYTLDENVSPDAKYYRAGVLRLPSGKNIAIMVEEEERFTGSAYTPFMPDGYVVYCSPRMGKMHYGGIPVAERGVGVRRIAAMEDVEEIITFDPPQHKIQYRTAPLPALEQGEAFYSQKIEA